jgi:hypothetical protein
VLGPDSTKEKKQIIGYECPLGRIRGKQEGKRREYGRVKRTALAGRALHHLSYVPSPFAFSSFF